MACTRSPLTKPLMSVVQGRGGCRSLDEIRGLCLDAYVRRAARRISRMPFNVALPSEELEARKADLSLKRKGASSEHAKDGAAEGCVQFNKQWHQLATRVAASSVHRADNSSAG